MSPGAARRRWLVGEKAVTEGAEDDGPELSRATHRRPPQWCSSHDDDAACGLVINAVCQTQPGHGIPSGSHLSCTIATFPASPDRECAAKEPCGERGLE